MKIYDASHKVIVHKCDLCHGDGKWYADRRKPCPKCKGTGGTTESLPHEVIFEKDNQILIELPDGSEFRILQREVQVGVFVLDISTVGTLKVLPRAANAIFLEDADNVGTLAHVEVVK